MLDNERCLTLGRTRMQLVSDWEECHLQFNALLASSQPVFVNRVGGSDTNAICAYLAALNGGEDKLQSTLKTHSEIVERFNGFYDLDNDPGVFISYMDKLLSIYKSSTDLLFCNRQLLSMYFSDNLHSSLVMNHIVGRDGFEMLFQLLLESGRVERCYPYNYVEKMVSHPLTLMHAFSDQLVGKKVLIVSPFAESIHLNFARRHEFFKGYQYPDVDLLTYNTPITYSGLPMHMYPHRNWFQTLDGHDARYFSDGIRHCFAILWLLCGAIRGSHCYLVG